MVHTDKFHLEKPKLHLIARLHAVQLRLEIKHMLIEFVLQNSERQSGPIYRHVQFLEQIRNPADMILMAVRQHNALDFIGIADKIGDIRDDEVDSQHVVVGEAETAVDDEHAVAVFEHGQVLSDFVKPAERYHT